MISAVSNRKWDPGNVLTHLPNAWKACRNPGDCLRSQMKIPVFEEHQCGWFGHGKAFLRKKSLGPWALKGGKAEPVFSIAVDDKLHPTDAKVALAVKEDNRLSL